MARPSTPLPLSGQNSDKFMDQMALAHSMLRQDFNKKSKARELKFLKI